MVRIHGTRRTATSNQSPAYGFWWFFFFGAIGALSIFAGVSGYLIEDPDSKFNSHYAWIYITIGVCSLITGIIPFFVRYIRKRRGVQVGE